MSEAVRLLAGDCVEVLRTLPAESVDACVTDPPYGIGFMGKEWDSFKPGNGHSRDRTGRHEGRKSPASIIYDYSRDGKLSFQVWSERWAAEILRVLKPGAHAVVCGAPRSFHRMACGVEDAGFEIRDSVAWLFGSGFPKSLNLGGGLGTALKPAHEPILVARKPFRGTVAANVAAYGTGALNVDDSRIGEGIITTGRRTTNRGHGVMSLGLRGGDDSDHVGRWPANVALDDLAAMVLDEQSGDISGTASEYDWGESKNDNPVHVIRNIKSGVHYGDNGGASRFFYCAKPSRAERDMGCGRLPTHSAGDMTDREDGSDGLRSPRAGAGRTGGGRNFHPTVKPIDLMRWLVRLVTPIGGTVIDPFLGSGTTGIACVLEMRPFIGIDREAAYLEVARHRISDAAPLFVTVP